MSVVKNTTGIAVTFTVKAANKAMEAAQVVFNAFPTGVTYASNSVSAGSYDVPSRTWTVGDLAAGASETITLTFTLQDASALPLDIVGVASSTTGDVNSSNNTITKTIDHDVLTAFEVVKEISANYTVQPGVDTFIAIDAVGGNVTLTLPASANWAKPDGGYYPLAIWVRDDNGGTSVVTIDGDAGDTIYDSDGAGTAANTGVTLVEATYSRIVKFDTDTPTNIMLF